jgi:hypothetical protein
LEYIPAVQFVHAPPSTLVFPAVQFVQFESDIAPTALDVPAGHCPTHWPAAEVVLLELPYLPTGQLTHSAMLVAAAAASSSSTTPPSAAAAAENLPPGQITQPLPLNENMPAIHGMHMEMFCRPVDMPVPLGQIPQH